MEFTATDANGNSSSASATITVIDSTSPTAFVQNITVSLDAFGFGSITANDINNGSNDNCGVDSIFIDRTNFGCADVSSNTVNFTVVDVNGNSSSATAVVLVEDNVVPNAVAQNISVILDASGNATILPSDINNGSDDACGIATMTVSPSTFDCSDVPGDNSISIVSDSTWALSTSVDSSTALTFPWAGAPFVPSSSTFTLPVELGQPYGYPSIPAVPGSEVVISEKHITYYRKTFPLTSLNQLGTRIRLSVDDDIEVYVNGHLLAAEYSFSQSSFQGMPHDLLIDTLGNATNGYNGGDQFGYVSTTPLDSIFQVGDNEIILAVRNRVGNDRGGFTMVMDVNADFQGNPVVLTVTDVNGNTSQAIGIVSVVDNAAPVITQMPTSFTAYTLVDDCTPPVYWTLPLASDACIVQSLVGTSHPGDHFPVGITTVTYTATDVNGNMSSASFDVNVIDTIAPTAVCNSFKVALDASGNAAITVADIDGGSTDACGIASASIDVSSFNCSNVGTNLVTLSLVDIYGNASSCTSVVTVVDSIAPIAQCQDITVALAANGLVDVNVDAINNGSYDACGIASVSISPNSFSCSEIGTNTVTLTVTDVNGNVSTCQSTVTVIDTIAAEVLTQNIAINLDNLGNTSITSADIDNGSNDACGVASLSLDQTSFDCNHLGANTVTLTATDANGNVSSATAIVTVSEGYFVEITPQADLDLTCNTGLGGRFVTWDEPAVGTYSSCAADTCPAGTTIPGFIFLGEFNGHRYFCSDNSNYTWDQANVAAQSAGGHLAVINDANENHYLACRVQAVFSWIGLTDQATEGQFDWVNGDPVSYTHWKNNEPNNVGGLWCGYNSVADGADYAVLKRWSGVWFDRRGCNLHEFIMEVPCGNGVMINQIAGPTPGSLFTQGTTTVTYVANDTLTGATDTSSFDVTVGDCTPVYCTASGNDASHEWIDRIKLGSIDNTSGTDNGYGDYTSMIAHTNKNQKVYFKLYPGFSGSKYKEYWRIFVDWNNDGDFFDYKECVYQGKSKNMKSGNFKVPHWASAGNLRVRVVMKWGGYAGPCSNYSYGEVEDYTIVVDNASGGGMNTKNATPLADNLTDDTPSIDQELFNLYPNPVLSGGSMTLDIRSAKEETVELSIMSATGQLIKTQTVNLREGLNSIEINPGVLSSGAYFIKIDSNEDAIPFVVKS